MSLENFAIIESTLREGEQFVGANFTTDQKVQHRRAAGRVRRRVHRADLAGRLAAEPPGLPSASPSLGLKAKILTHTRCTMEDAKLAVDTGVNGIDVLFGTSSYLRQFSHGKSIAPDHRRAAGGHRYIKSQGLEVRFSSEDSFRSTTERPDDGLYRRGSRSASTAWASPTRSAWPRPRQVYDLVTTLRTRGQGRHRVSRPQRYRLRHRQQLLRPGSRRDPRRYQRPGHRRAQRHHPARRADRAHVRDEQELLCASTTCTLLRDLDNLVAEIVGIGIPFNNYITGITAFTHKAGIHAKAVLNNPETYEILDPHDFGMTRYISIAHRLTGWNAVATGRSSWGLTADG